MPIYEVSYYKYLLNSEGRACKALQKSVDVDAADPIAALSSIETRGLSLENCDCLEVSRLDGAPAMAEWRT
jgi:hypothetical protein